MNKITCTLFACLLICCFNYCKQDVSREKEKTPETTQASEDDEIFLIKPPSGYYQPEGLRPLNLVEQYKFAKTKIFTNTFPLKDKFGKPARWDTLLSSPVPIFLQIYVNAQNQAKEGVVYEMNDTIQGLIMRIRFAHSGDE